MLFVFVTFCSLCLWLWNFFIFLFFWISSQKILAGDACLQVSHCVSYLCLCLYFFIFLNLISEDSCRRRVLSNELLFMLCVFVIFFLVFKSHLKRSSQETHASKWVVLYVICVCYFLFQICLNLNSGDFRRRCVPLSEMLFMFFVFVTFFFWNLISGDSCRRRVPPNETFVCYWHAFLFFGNLTTWVGSSKKAIYALTVYVCSWQVFFFF